MISFSSFNENISTKCFGFILFNDIEKCLNLVLISINNPSFSKTIMLNFRDINLEDYSFDISKIIITKNNNIKVKGTIISKNNSFSENDSLNWTIQDEIKEYKNDMGNIEEHSFLYVFKTLEVQNHKIVKVNEVNNILNMFYKLKLDEEIEYDNLPNSFKNGLNSFLDYFFNSFEKKIILKSNNPIDISKLLIFLIVNNKFSNLKSFLSMNNQLYLIEDNNIEIPNIFELYKSIITPLIRYLEALLQSFVFLNRNTNQDLNSIKEKLKSKYPDVTDVSYAFSCIDGLISQNNYFAQTDKKFTFRFSFNKLTSELTEFKDIIINYEQFCILPIQVNNHNHFFEKIIEGIFDLNKFFYDLKEKEANKNKDSENMHQIYVSEDNELKLMMTSCKEIQNIKKKYNIINLIRQEEDIILLLNNILTYNDSYKIREMMKLVENQKFMDLLYFDDETNFRICCMDYLLNKLFDKAPIDLSRLTLMIPDFSPDKLNILEQIILFCLEILININNEKIKYFSKLKNDFINKNSISQDNIALSQFYFENQNIIDWIYYMIQNPKHEFESYEDHDTKKFPNFQYHIYFLRDRNQNGLSNHMRFELNQDQIDLIIDSISTSVNIKQYLKKCMFISFSLIEFEFLSHFININKLSNNYYSFSNFFKKTDNIFKMSSKSSNKLYLLKLLLTTFTLWGKTADAYSIFVNFFKRINLDKIQFKIFQTVFKLNKLSFLQEDTSNEAKRKLILEFLIQIINKQGLLFEFFQLKMENDDENHLKRLILDNKNSNQNNFPIEFCIKYLISRNKIEEAKLYLQMVDSDESNLSIQNIMRVFTDYENINEFEQVCIILCCLIFSMSRENKSNRNWLINCI